MQIQNLHFSHSSQFFLPIPPPNNPFRRALKLDGRPGCSSAYNLVPRSQTARVKQARLPVIRCGTVEKDDSYYMRRAVEVARNAVGCTSPNPMVGCVIVKDGEVVGEGFHPKAGQPHAEVFALRDAGHLAANATAYVSLEPCNHFGRTPPCSEALVEAKVKKVVIGMVDPNPIVASRGVDRLREAGIDVVIGVEEELCKKLNEAYIHKMLTGKPFLALRYSISVNGHFLDQLGEGGTTRGGYYSLLLQEYDAIIFSTPLDGKFSLPKSQEPGANQPLWIVAAKNPHSSFKIPALDEASSQVIIFTDEEKTVEPETARRGIETVVLDRIDLAAVLEYCTLRGMCSVLLDLRGSVHQLEELLKDAIEHNMLQKIIVEILPVWDESADRSSLQALDSLEKRLKVNNLRPSMLDQSVVLEGYL